MKEYKKKVKREFGTADKRKWREKDQGQKEKNSNYFEVNLREGFLGLEAFLSFAWTSWKII
jgi:hypothetical protein